MKNIFSVVMLLFFSSTSLSAALVSDDEASISDASYLSECSQLSVDDVLAYRLHTIKNLDVLIQKGGITLSKQAGFKTQVENFYSMVRSFLSVEPSRDNFNQLSNFRALISNNLFSNHRGFFCSRVDLTGYRDAIVNDLDAILDIIENTLEEE